MKMLGRKVFVIAKKRINLWRSTRDRTGRNVSTDQVYIGQRNVSTDQVRTLVPVNCWKKIIKHVLHTSLPVLSFEKGNRKQDWPVATSKNFSNSFAN